MKCPNKKSEQYKELLEITNGNELLANHMWYTLDTLKDEGYIANSRFKLASGKYAYKIPKITTERSLAKKPAGWDKNYGKKQHLEKVLDDNNVDWISVVETPNAFLLKLSIPELQTPLQQTKVFDVASIIDSLSELMFEEDYKLSEQALKEQELAEDKERKLANKKEDNIKPGVSEIFDSNPELANAVYEALGFDNLKSKVTLSKKFADTYNIVFNGEIIGTIDIPSDLEGDTISIGDVNIKPEFRGKGLGVETYKAAIKIAGKPLESFMATDEANRVWNSLIKQGLAKKTDTGFVTISAQITPQQKQQAQQLYSQYLDTIFPNSKVKDIVYHGVIKGRDAYNNILEKGFDFKSKRNWDSPKSSFKEDDNTGMFFSDRATAQSYGIELTYKVNKKGEYEDIAYDNTIPAILNIKYLETSKLTSSGSAARFYRENNNKSLIGMYGLEGGSEGEHFNYVVFEPEQIHILGSKQDIEGFKKFVKQPVKQQGQLSLFTEEDFNQKFPNFAELQPFEKKIINDNKDEDLDIICNL